MKAVGSSESEAIGRFIEIAKGTDGRTFEF